MLTLDDLRAYRKGKDLFQAMVRATDDEDAQQIRAKFRAFLPVYHAAERKVDAALAERCFPFDAYREACDDAEEGHDR